MPPRQRDTGKSGGSTWSSVGQAVANTAKKIITPQTSSSSSGGVVGKKSTGSVGKKNTTSYSSGSTSSGNSGRASASYSGSSGSSGGGTGGYSGGSFDSGGGGGYTGGGFSSTAVAEPVQTEVAIPDPLQQESYKRARAEMMRARGDFDAQQNLARSQYDATFADAQRQLGWRDAIPRRGLRALQAGEGNDEAGFDPSAQGTAYGDAYQANAGDFAGRGLYHSGLYAQAVNNVNNQFTDRRNTALRDQKDWRDTQALNQRNFYGQQDAADLAAQEDAIGQIMAQLGVSRDQVTPGRQNTIYRSV